MAFPDPRKHEFQEWLPHGEYLYYGPDIISLGDELTVNNLRDAYQKGIFPWHMDGMPLPRFCPRKRAILEFADLHIPKSLERARRRSQFSFTIDKDFRSVIAACSKAFRPGQDGTWITPRFIETYTALHEGGMAHSVEAWDTEDKLCGGVYGVDAGGVFCGESMFFKKPNASKLALLYLFDHLRSRGSTWFDTQVITPHMKVLGAKEIDRWEFFDKLRDTQSKHFRCF